MKSSLATRLSELLKTRKIDDRELSRRTKVDYVTIYRIMNGETKKPNRSNLDLIAKELSTSVQYLLTGEGDRDFIHNDESQTNPYKDALVSELKSQVEYLKEMLRLAMGNKNFLQALNGTGLNKRSLRAAA